MGSSARVSRGGGVTVRGIPKGTGKQFFTNAFAAQVARQSAKRVRLEASARSAGKGGGVGMCVR